MTFQNIRLPTEMEKGAYGITPEFYVATTRLTNGSSRKLLLRAKPIRKWDVSYGMQGLVGAAASDGLLALYDFYMARGGSFNTFRMRDWLDYQLVDEEIATGDASTTVFQIIKTYTDFGGFTRSENITKPSNNAADPAWVVKINGSSAGTEGVDWTIDYATGELTFIVPPGNTLPITVTGYFDRHVSFSRDVKFDLEWAQAGKIKKVMVEEEFG